RPAAQDLLELLLEPVLAELESGREQQRAGLGFVLFARCCPDIPDQVPHCPSGRIVAGKAALRHDAMQVRQPHADGRKGVIVEAVGDLYGLEAGCLVYLVAQILDLDRREAQQISKRLDRSFRILQSVWNDVDAKVGAVGSERRAVTVEDPAPARRDQSEVHPVALGLHLIFFVFGDRDVAHARGKEHAHAALDRADDEAATLESLGKQGGSELLTHDFQLMRLTRMSRKRSRCATRRATNGNSMIESSS